MANNSRTNPFQVDTASDARLVADTSEVMISGIMITTSNATWAVILKDGVGNTIFSVDNNGAVGSMQPCVPFKTTGLVVGTLTNATVLIYTVPS